VAVSRLVSAEAYDSLVRCLIETICDRLARGSAGKVGWRQSGEMLGALLASVEVAYAVGAPDGRGIRDPCIGSLAAVAAAYRKAQVKKRQKVGEAKARVAKTGGCAFCAGQHYLRALLVRCWIYLYGLFRPLDRGMCVWRSSASPCRPRRDMAGVRGAAWPRTLLAGICLMPCRDWRVHSWNWLHRCRAIK